MYFTDLLLILLIYPPPPPENVGTPWKMLDPLKPLKSIVFSEIKIVSEYDRKLDPPPSVNYKIS